MPGPCSSVRAGPTPRRGRGVRHRLRRRPHAARPSPGYDLVIALDLTGDFYGDAGQFDAVQALVAWLAAMATRPGGRSDAEVGGTRARPRTARPTGRRLGAGPCRDLLLDRAEGHAEELLGLGRSARGLVEPARSTPSSSSSSWPRDRGDSLATAGVGRPSAGARDREAARPHITRESSAATRAMPAGRAGDGPVMRQRHGPAGRSSPVHGVVGSARSPGAGVAATPPASGDVVGGGRRGWSDDRRWSRACPVAGRWPRAPRRSPASPVIDGSTRRRSSSPVRGRNPTSCRRRASATCPSWRHLARRPRRARPRAHVRGPSRPRRCRYALPTRTPEEIREHAPPGAGPSSAASRHRASPPSPASATTTRAMNDIAEAAGVTKPVLYQHFGSKRDLFLAVAERWRGDGCGPWSREATTSADGPRQQVERGFAAWFRWVSGHRDGFHVLFDTRSVATRSSPRRRPRPSARFADGSPSSSSSTVSARSAEGSSPTASSAWVRPRAAVGWPRRSISTPTSWLRRWPSWPGPGSAASTRLIEPAGEGGQRPCSRSSRSAALTA